MLMRAVQKPIARFVQGSRVPFSPDSHPGRGSQKSKGATQKRLASGTEETQPAMPDVRSLNLRD